MRKTKRAIALLLAVLMCTGLFTSFAFADDVTAVKNEKQQFNIVALGDASATGFGLSDYGKATKDGKWIDTYSGSGCSFGILDNASASSYIYQFANYINNMLLSTHDVNVYNLALEGMRTDELRAILQPGFKKLAAQKGEYGDMYLSGHLDAYNAWFSNPSNAAKLGDKSMEEYFTDAIKSADVITVDLSMSNYSDYLLQRISAILGMGDYNPKDYSESAKDLDNQSDTDYAAIESTVKSLMKTYAPKNENFPTDKIVEALVYCYADFTANFSKDIELILKLNSTAKIIIIGAHNNMSGMRLDFDGEVFDLSTLWNSYLSFTNNYITNMCKYNKQYFFASSTSGIRSYFQSLSVASDSSEIDTGYANVLVEQALNMSYPGKGTEYLSKQNELASLKAQKRAMEDADQMELPEYDVIVERIRAIDTEDYALLCQQADTVLNSYMRATKLTAVDMNGAAKLVNAGTAAVNDAIANAIFNWDRATDAEKSMLYLNARFLIADGMGSLPSAYGCNQKFEILKAAYIKVLPANTDGEGSLVGIGGAFASVLQVFKTPILEKISGLFRSFSFGEFFTNLRNNLSNWLVNIFPRR